MTQQSCKDFLWLIVDDGSQDDTKELVNSWIKEKRISIQYCYQENQGMHGAHNTAYSLINTELNVCIDSDDYLATGAVEKIITFWRANGSDQYAGIVGLDASPDGIVIGTKMPPKLIKSTLSDLYAKHKVKGDKKLVYRSEVTRKTPPYPLYPGEKYCPLAYKYILIDQIHPLLIMNEVLCHVEYLEDGSSMNIIKQYKRNPRGFLFYRKAVMVLGPTYKERFKACVHYVSSSMMIRNCGFVQEAPNKLMTLLAIPFGMALYFYLKRTKKPTVLKST